LAASETIVAEHGEILIYDDICNRQYRFSADDVAALFDDYAGQSIH
jgi:molecular chaperone Hsp33